MKLMTKNNDDDDANSYLPPAGAGADSEFATSAALTWADWVELLQTGVLLGFVIGPSFGLIALLLDRFGHRILMAIVLLLGVWLVSVVVTRDYAVCRRKRLEENRMWQRIEELNHHSETNS